MRQKGNQRTPALSHCPQLNNIMYSGVTPYGVGCKGVKSQHPPDRGLVGSLPQEGHERGADDGCTTPRGQGSPVDGAHVLGPEHVREVGGQHREQAPVEGHLCEPRTRGQGRGGKVAALLKISDARARTRRWVCVMLFSLLIFLL